MTKHNANNERIKRKYTTFLKQAKGQNEATVDSVAKPFHALKIIINIRISKHSILSKL
jgi:hypothetical protein